jgi:hypothetical protein
MCGGPVNPSTTDTGFSTVPLEPSPSTAPLLLWLLVQLGAIVIAVLRVPLAAAYPEPAERLAPHLLLAVQVIAAGILFPFLLRDWRTAAQVVATAVPFQLASAYLAGVGARGMLPAMTFVLSWIVVLAVWRPCLTLHRMRALAISIATCLTLGGGVLRYLRLEFGRGSSDTSFETASPLLTTLAALGGESTSPGWLLLGGLGLGAVITVVFRRHFRRRTVRLSRIPA